MTSEYSIFESPHSLDSFLLTTFSSCLQCLPLFLCLHYHLVPQDLLLDLLQVYHWEGGRREGREGEREEGEREEGREGGREKGKEGRGGGGRGRKAGKGGEGRREGGREGKRAGEESMQ